MSQQTLSAREALRLAERASLAAGASPASAPSLARVTVAAALNGRPGVGFPYLLDYLAGFRAGRIASRGQVSASPASAIPSTRSA